MELLRRLTGQLQVVLLLLCVLLVLFHAPATSCKITLAASEIVVDTTAGPMTLTNVECNTRNCTCGTGNQCRQLTQIVAGQKWNSGCVCVMEPTPSIIIGNPVA